MLYIFGDSHAAFNFKGLRIPHVILNENSVTMHRIGRDSQIIHYNQKYSNPENIFVFTYGEVDCRCHIGRQVLLGRNFEEICSTLVESYINTIKKEIRVFKQVILLPIVPPMSDKYCTVPKDFIYPMIGNDSERINSTVYINSLLKDACQKNGYLFLDFYDHYTDEYGTLRFDDSDKIVHIAKNEYINTVLIDLLSQHSLI